ncbi:hypothetical protein ABZW11_17285 [Nonomuraea sp. NPDC004580]|uniref:hypothetical protein n=1 Tax=Nonomuraea sp. NPDC004580 TaxID=3154552 RepID=UPI0033BB2345
MSQPKTAKELLDQLGAKWSPDFDAYAAGETSSPRCVLCTKSPCTCPEFGTPEYLALLDKRHGRRP